MKKRLATAIAVLGLVAIFSSASATTLTDSYNGGNGHTYGDVITDPSVTIFDIDSLDASLSGNQLTVTVHTNFAGHAGVDPQWTKNRTGIGYGDLFLSSGWSPYGSSPYNSDNAANGNHWTYAFSLDDALSNSGGNGTIYALGAGVPGNNNPDVLLSDYFITCGGSCIFRNGQAVAVDTSRATATSNTGTWSVGNGFVTFSFDTTGLNLGPDFGVHWTMDCGNDVIEGLAHATVPEPAPVGLFLLGLGLIGLGAVRQRKTARQYAR